MIKINKTLKCNNVAYIITASRAPLMTLADALLTFDCTIFAFKCKCTALNSACVLHLRGGGGHFFYIFQKSIFISPKCLIMHCIFVFTIVLLLHNSLHCASLIL
uniref:Uncharacterized protein n=1 Tax=Sinocyclocheilus rhinocerous TaxID=307959 RepID=A0A673IC59_9TELE